MSIVRKVIHSDELKNILDLPDDMQHQEVELLVIPLNKSKKKNSDFDPNRYRGITNIPDLENSLQSLRDEWDR